MAPTKRQTTFAKIAREQALKEKRARKQEKKDERKLAAQAALAGDVPVEEAEGSEEAVDADALAATPESQ